MYKELSTFLNQIVRKRAIWKDGELWTALIVAVSAYIWMVFDSTVVGKIRLHFGELLSVTSIVFGFALAALLFYIQAAGAWVSDGNVVRIAKKIVDWHVWTLVCLLSLIAYIICLWALGTYIDNNSQLTRILHTVLVFNTVYVGLQILNHTLTIWWTFQSRDRLNS